MVTSRSQKVCLHCFSTPLDLCKHTVYRSLRSCQTSEEGSQACREEARCGQGQRNILIVPTMLTCPQKEKAPKKEEAKEAKPKAKATKAKGPGRPKGSTTATKAKKVTTAKKPAAAKPKANTATKRAPKAKAKTEAPVRCYSVRPFSRC